MWQSKLAKLNKNTCEDIFDLMAEIYPSQEFLEVFHTNFDSSLSKITHKISDENEK